jgi:nucleoside-diphosphate-sugar epimerase
MTGVGINADSLSDQPSGGAVGRVLVTGASGFIGAALVRDFAPSFRVRAASRAALRFEDAVTIGDLGPETDWRAALDDVDVVVHLAGPAHAGHPPELIERAIVGGTRALLDQAVAAGVRRFIYVSSIHACARRTTGAPLDEDTPPRPDDAYGRAKLAAERAVQQTTQLQPIVVRPPLVHGAGAKGNFGRLLRLLDSDLPLPLGGIANKRSVISLGSFTAAMIAVLKAPSITSLFHLADEPAVSTSEMAALLRQGMGRRARVFPLPGLSLVAPAAMVESLEVDARRFKQTFGYAGVDTREALVACGREWAAR